MAAVALVVGAASADSNGWFGEITAAWIQAVGSVAAIIGAILIDQGAARRQRLQLEAADTARAREKLEVLLAVSGLAAYVIETTQLCCDGLRQESWTPIEVPLARRWARAVVETRTAIEELRGRVTDPVVLIELVPFLHALDPPADWQGLDKRQVVEGSLQEMSVAGRQLIASIQTIADAADLEMDIPALATA